MPSVAEHVRSADLKIAADRLEPSRDLVAERLRAFPAARLNRRITTRRYEAEVNSRLLTTAR